MESGRITISEARAVLAQAATGNLDNSDRFKAACRLALEQMPKELGADRTPATIMVCSDCGAEIARLEPLPAGEQFDIYDCSWPCPKCGRLWLSGHGWQEVGNLLIPHGTV